MRLASPALAAALLALAASALAAPSQAVFGAAAQDMLARPVRFDGHRLVHVVGLRPDDVAWIAERMDVWGEGHSALTVRVSPEQYQLLKDNGYEMATVVDNVQEDIDAETERLRQPRAFTAAEWFSDYHPYADIKTYFSQLAAQNPKLVTFIPSIGKTVENRDIFAVKITSGKKPSYGGEKKQVWFNGLQHAREWIGGAVVQYISANLIGKYGSDAEVTSLLDELEYIIVPVVNPDGYEYTWTTNRLWRKNRAIVAGKVQGVDLNRNWNDHWGEGGSSTSPSSDTYRGPAAASEPEVQAIGRFFREEGKVIAGIDFHSFSQLILRPYGWTSKSSVDEPLNKKVGDGIRDIIKKVSGKSYTSQKSIDLYATSGTLSDWFNGDVASRGHPKRAYGFTIELRPASSAGNSGFILDPKEIIPTGEEIFPAILYYSRFALENPLQESTPL